MNSCFQLNLRVIGIFFIKNPKKLGILTYNMYKNEPPRGQRPRPGGKGSPQESYLKNNNVK